jgi:hypothetical protein
MFGLAAVSILVPEISYTEVRLGFVSFSTENAETTSRNNSHQLRNQASAAMLMILRSVKW